MKRICYVMLLVLLIAAMSCNEDDEPKIPADVMTVDVKIGEEVFDGVYLDSLCNFLSYQSLIGFFSIGKNGGLDMNPNGSLFVTRVAAELGNYYQIVSSSGIRRLNDGLAYELKDYYYNVYVDSWIYDEQHNIVGAKIIYTHRKPNLNDLPEWNSVVEMNLQPQNGQGAKSASYSFKKGCKISSMRLEALDPGNSGFALGLDIKPDGNKITIISSPDFPNGKAVLYMTVRQGGVCSQVKLVVNSSI